MKRLMNRIIVSVFAVCVLGTTSGCDEAGVLDIVWGSAQLAYGIVDVAT